MIDNCKPWEFPALCTPIGQLHQTPPMPVQWDRARGKQMGLGARRQGQLPSRVTRKQPRFIRNVVENTFFFNFFGWSLLGVWRVRNGLLRRFKTNSNSDRFFVDSKKRRLKKRIKRPLTV